VTESPAIKSLQFTRWRRVSGNENGRKDHKLDARRCGNASACDHVEANRRSVGIGLTKTTELATRAMEVCGFAFYGFGTGPNGFLYHVVFFILVHLSEVRPT
jgi:hypothetical protein